MKTLTLNQILTDAEINQAIAKWRETYLMPRAFHSWTLARLIEPNMARINAALGQENDARFLAYAVEYAMMILDEKQSSYA